MVWLVETLSVDGRPLPTRRMSHGSGAQDRASPYAGWKRSPNGPTGPEIVRTHPTPIFDASGELAGAVNMLVDLTERKQAEENAQHLGSIVAFRTTRS